ncbi:hypothetical protein PRIPAC_85148 [Pristionchus pacificus]|uniref:Uncharacterized protein n=1 Tax=Pristionchus pacificus TaxID=54126 RepID=A0A2A6BSR9_PRIPA|nr:hypothetical protein PRIPAC_85148 [Pristionchus pacificus]|eukprot:PDM68853.1 hypothetical protein PRIPAC_47155 [Pristionchus pacificus]
MLFFGWIFILFVPVNANWERNIQEIITSVERLRGTTSTAILDIEKTSQDTYELLMMWSKIGSLLDESTKSKFDPSSDEAKGMMLLHTHLIKQLRKIERDGLMLENQLFYNNVETFYQLKAGRLLWNLVRQFENFTDSNRPDSPNDFIRTCSSSREGPDRILKSINEFYHQNCPLPSSDVIDQYVRLLEALRNYAQLQGYVKYLKEVYHEYLAY